VYANTSCENNAIKNVAWYHFLSTLEVKLPGFNDTNGYPLVSPQSSSFE